MSKNNHNHSGIFESPPAGFVPACECGCLYECPKCKSKWGKHSETCIHKHPKIDYLDLPHGPIYRIEK